jgi:hypothetical protein
MLPRHSKAPAAAWRATVMIGVIPVAIGSNGKPERMPMKNAHTRGHHRLIFFTPAVAFSHALGASVTDDEKTAKCIESEKSRQIEN